jgi:hypothetical protein
MQMLGAKVLSDDILSFNPDLVIELFAIFAIFYFN